jgi:GNAT superfamily N-acetyltransferase
MNEFLQLDFHPLTLDRWQDFEALFGLRGACGGCWCMYWKLARQDFSRNQGEGNRTAQQKYVRSGNVPGLIAYHGNIPCGWIAVEPRERYPVLNNSHILKTLDEKPVWSVTCFFVARNYRRRGITIELLKEAIRHVTIQGGTRLEGYPSEIEDGKKKSPVFIYSGGSTAFIKSGFLEAGRRSEKRPIMRYEIK